MFFDIEIGWQPIDAIHDAIEATASRHTPIKHAHNIGVAQRTENVDFALKAHQLPSSRKHSLAEHFQRHGPAGRSLNRLVHNPLPATMNLMLNVVTGKYIGAQRRFGVLRCVKGIKLRRTSDAATGPFDHVEVLQFFREFRHQLGVVGDKRFVGERFAGDAPFNAIVDQAVDKGQSISADGSGDICFFITGLHLREFPNKVLQ